MNGVTTRLAAAAMLLILLAVGAGSCMAQVRPPAQASPDLGDMARNGELRAGARQVEELEQGARSGAHVSAAPGELPIWIPGLDFATGTIAVDVRGKDLPGQSFLGIAFGGVNDSTFEAVYVRPFNFRAADPGRQAHSVQYISLPGYPWQRLRSEQPEVFESLVDPAPDPADWVALRLVVERSRVQVFVGEGAAPDLVVDRLSDGVGRRVGLWVGNNSEGDFSNMRISGTQ